MHFTHKCVIYIYIYPYLYMLIFTARREPEFYRNITALLGSTDATFTPQCFKHLLIPTLAPASPHTDGLKASQLIRTFTLIHI